MELEHFQAGEVKEPENGAIAYCYQLKRSINLLIRKCPYCGKKHYHGNGGDKTKPELGSRGPHCSWANLRKAGWTEDKLPPDYILVLESDDIKSNDKEYQYEINKNESNEIPPSN
jgi:hypothetical protein